MRRWAGAVALVVGLGGCIQDGVTQVAGIGAMYTTRCSAEMEPKGAEFVARCEPAACEERFHSASVNQVVVWVIPNEKVVGYAERVCLQDLSNASALFNPILEPPPEAKAETDAKSEDTDK